MESEPRFSLIMYLYTMQLLPSHILFLLHPSPGEELADAFRQEVSAINDWDPFVSSLIRNGLLPLFRSAAMETGVYGSLPEAVRTKVDDAVRSQTMRNLRLLSTLLTLQEVLTRNNIPFVLIKGFAMAATCYPDISRRPMIDIDILVHAGDVPRIRELLRPLGGEKFSEPQSEFFATLTSHEPGILLNSVLIEPHTTLIKGARNLTLTECPIQPVVLSGKELKMPSPDVHLLFLMMHVHKHLPKERGKLLWLRDTACMMQKVFHQGEVAEESFFRLAEDYHCLPPVLQITSLMQSLMPDLLPRPLQQPLPALNDTIMYSLQVVLEYGIIGRNDPGPRLRYFSELPGIGGKVMFLAGLLFPSLAYMKKRYPSFPSRAVFLLYPWHFFRVIFKGMYMLVRFIGKLLITRL